MLVEGTLMPISGHANNDPCMEQAKTWIDKCVNTHSHCRPLNSDGNQFLPTRLIDVSDAPEGTRLVLTKNLKVRDTRYLVLSHCWGEGIPDSAITTVYTLDSRLLSISWHNLTRTFKDICRPATSLQIRYVWVDSLSNIQDYLVDWTHKSRLMGKVFSHAYCKSLRHYSWHPKRGDLLIPRFSYQIASTFDTKL
jgi:hypothetical protein